MTNLKRTILLIGGLVLSVSIKVNEKSEQDSGTTCEAEAGPPGSTAFVKCHFNTDIKQTKRNVVLQKIIFGQTENTPETISFCYWSEDGEAQCKNKDGFVCKIEDNQMEVKILKVTQDCEGLYKCHLRPPDDSPVHPCRLTVTETPSTQQTSEYTTPTEETSKTTATENCENLEAKESLIKGLIAGLVVLSVISLAVIAALFFLLYKRLRYCCVGCLSHPRRGHNEDLHIEAEVPLSGLSEPSEGRARS